MSAAYQIDIPILFGCRKTFDPVDDGFPQFSHTVLTGRDDLLDTQGATGWEMTSGLFNGFRPLSPLPDKIL
jgi:hypothetical protein